MPQDRYKAPARSPLRVRTLPAIEAHFRALAEAGRTTVSALISLAMAEYAKRNPVPTTTQAKEAAK